MLFLSLSVRQSKFPSMLANGTKPTQQTVASSVRRAAPRYPRGSTRQFGAGLSSQGTREDGNVEAVPLSPTRGGNLRRGRWLHQDANAETGRPIRFRGGGRASKGHGLITSPMLGAEACFSSRLSLLNLGRHEVVRRRGASTLAFCLVVRGCQVKTQTDNSAESSRCPTAAFRETCCCFTIPRSLASVASFPPPMQAPIKVHVPK